MAAAMSLRRPMVAAMLFTDSVLVLTQALLQ